MKISIVAAMGRNRVIGKSNTMPWHMPADLKYFKALTMGKPMIMGRKTFESIGKALAGRRTIVLTTQQGLELPGCEVFNSLEAALEVLVGCDEIMIVGGAQIYEQIMPSVHCMYLTFIEHEFEGDAFFPEWDESEWQVVSEEYHKADEKHKYHYRFVKLERI